uniref:Uncharacterized protein n=1 Tax=Eutreptiella gymnastica TaxID=73025 RepID=A0A6U8NSU8_9EUGL
MAKIFGVVLLIGLLLSVEAAPLTCYIDTDIANGTGTDDGRAMCTRTTTYFDLGTNKNVKCEQGTHSCISLMYGGYPTGGGCTPSAYTGMTCDIWKALDKRIGTCEYCTSDLCNTCADGAALGLTMSVGMLVTTLGVLSLLLA